MTEAANDDGPCCYYHQVMEQFSAEWNKRCEDITGDRFQAEDLLEAHGSPLAFVIASAIKSGHSREAMFASVMSMLTEAVDVDLAVISAPRDKKELN